MQIEEPRRPNPSGTALLALGFRPFFLLAGLGAVGLLAIWLGYVSAPAQLQAYYAGTFWHAHEMLFGYTVAVICGFLLTAVRNWTDIPTPSGGALGLLALLWILGRLLPLAGPGVPGWLIAGVDLALLPALAWVVGVRVLRRRQTSNLIFAVLPLLMMLANLLVHLEMLGLTRDTAWYGLYGMVWLVMLIIVLMGGRVIPFFAERGVQGLTTRSWPVVEWLSPWVIVAAAVSHLFLSDALTFWAALLAFVVHAARVFGWYHRLMWREPLVWVLIFGYAWLVLGLGLLALAELGWISGFIALHAFTVGGLGGITLGMMSRVAIGHTGRPMKLPRGMVWSYYFLYASAMVRVFFPLFLPDTYVREVMAAGGLWILAFLVFLHYYTPILMRPRVDGRPG